MFNRILILNVLILVFMSQCFAEKTNKSPDAQKNEKTVINQNNDDWANIFHKHIANSVYSSASWFDSFFLAGGKEQKQPQASLRIKLGWEPKAGNWSEFGARFKVKIRLPHLKDKVDIILSDDTEDESNNLPLESINRQSELSDRKFSAAINLTHKKKNNLITDTRIGITGGDFFIRARHKRIYSWDNTHLLRIEPALYYFLEDKLDAKLLLGYRYQLASEKQLRVNLSFRTSEKDHGVRWKNGYYHLNHLSDEQASVIGLLIEGEHNGLNGSYIDKYTLSYRYRFSAFKKWIFFEIEPFIEFPHLRDYRRTPGLALRVEGIFSKN